VAALGTTSCTAGKAEEVYVDNQMDEMVGYAAASRLIGIRLSTLYSYVSRKDIPHYRLGKRLVVFSVEELQDWMRTRRVPVVGIRR
jgi:excisionase family DNA binding protein